MRTAIEALDHLVLATPDLTETTRWVAESTGVTPSMGGRHVGKGTANMLCSLGPTTYLEIVGPDPEQDDPAGGRPFGIDDLSGAELVSWAIAVRDMDAALVAARAAGYDPGEAVAMQRLRPDGVLLSWRLTIAPSRTVPFLIDWLDSPHPAPAAAPGLRLSVLRAQHPQPELLSADLRALDVDMPTTAGREGLIVELVGPAGVIGFAPA